VPTLLLTRPRDSAEDFAKAANWAGRVVISPLIAVHLRAIRPPAPEEGVIVTSQHGVRALAAARAQRDWPVWCVGPGTMAAAQAAGFRHVQAGGGTAETLFQALVTTPDIGPLVHVRGAHVVTDLAGRLNAAGLQARAVIGYDQQACALTDTAQSCLMSAGRVVVPVFSPRSARLFAAEWGKLTAPRAALHGVAISPAAAEGMRRLPWQGLQVAAQPDLAGMLTALAQMQAALEPDRNPR